ncbi:MAG TPA: hypothetical protein VK934_01325 [Fimbriimonas sp.]|nr:hypothetical protein [Fimbriimonas sp.]
MLDEKYLFFKALVGVLATVGLYSVLYRENKFYRFFEHVFLGLAAGWAIVALWTESLYSDWYTKIVGSAGENGAPGVPGYWAYVILLPIGMMAYTVFSPKHNWMSRIPIGIILGLWSGQQIQVWWNRYGAQMSDSIKPILPTTTDFFAPGTNGLDPAAAAQINSQVYVSQAITNIIFTITLLSALSYFLFSVEMKNKFLRNMTTMGRLLLMVGFGAIFGSTVMMRFTLLIDRMYFIFIEFLKNDVYMRLFGGGG